ncbi:hypothetical protein LUZ63_014963 [Rhynchospora breviuscula]|uniref:Uncharacterized protein n=1 Tax=Rhynchospora breviuscula TaxID=2022672 RepID=A0A9Q0HM61_9POAL|nr:hypothetical protein LUZ63_014963 [Rhynchospora breviuscula]
MGQRISTNGSSEEMVLAGAGETNLISTAGNHQEIVPVGVDQTNLISTGESYKVIISTGAGDTNFVSTDATAHQFKVNFLNMKDLSNGQGMASPIFKSGGHKWIIHCHPKGYDKNKDNNTVSLFLELLNDCAELYVNFTLAILGKSGSQPLQMTSSKSRKFTNATCMWGWDSFTKRTDLEEKYVTKEGYFYILCSINIINQKFDWTSRFPVGHVKDDISKLWESGAMADVKFEVEGEIICAHKVILAARSSVFKAELKSHMAEGKIIRIKDMKSEVFRALLQFIYNNSFDNERDTNLATSVMTQHLLAAASRYAIEGLIVRCEDYLLENLCFDTVMDVLILGEQHCLFKLKEACLEFISRQENFVKISITDGPSLFSPSV